MLKPIPSAKPLSNESADRPSWGGSPLGWGVLWRYVDLAVLLIALPLFILFELPMVGFAIGAGIYTGQRLLADFLQNRAVHATKATAMLGFLVGGLIGRGWMVALAIFGAGFFAGQAAGLAAAVLFLAAFSIYFTTSLIFRSSER